MYECRLAEPLLKITLSPLSMHVPRSITSNVTSLLPDTDCLCIDVAVPLCEAHRQPRSSFTRWEMAAWRLMEGKGWERSATPGFNTKMAIQGNCSLTRHSVVSL